VLEKYSADQIRGTQFDPDSIMLYFFPPSWTKSGKGTKANETLSDLDIAFIASEQAYPHTEVQATKLTVNAAPTTAAIGQPGEEDLFQFSVSSGGRYVVETSGKTDVIMKLFGPGSQTSLIAEDDDSGYGLNARIAAELMPGQYFVQVRHYNKSGGTGSYRIKVRK